MKKTKYASNMVMYSFKRNELFGGSVADMHANTFIRSSGSEKERHFEVAQCFLDKQEKSP